MELKIEEALKLTYEEYIEYLFKKYGTVKDFLKTKQKTDKELNGNYFLTNSFKSKNTNITRGNEGLFIHHIDEDKVNNLSMSEFAKNYPYEFQLSERLVYCDLMEHLLLHLKIIENPKPIETEQVGFNGFNTFIVPVILDFFAGYKPPKDHHYSKARERIINKKDEFLFILKYMKDNKVFEKYRDFYQKYYEQQAKGNIYLNILETPEYKIRSSMAQITGVFNLDINSSIVKKLEKLGWKVSDF